MLPAVSVFVGIEHVSTVLASAPPPTLTPHWIEFDGVPPLRLVSHCHKHWCGLQSDGIVSLTTKTWFESSFAAETVGASSSDGGGGGGGEAEEVAAVIAPEAVLHWMWKTRC